MSSKDFAGEGKNIAVFGFFVWVFALRFYFLLIVRQEDSIRMMFFPHFFAYGEERHRYGVFFAFLYLWEGATPLWCFFRISLLVGRSYTAMVFFPHFFAYGEEQHRYDVFSAFLCLWGGATPLR